MANAVLVMCDTTVLGATITAQLNTMHASNPITLVTTGGENAGERAATAWATTNGVPWLAKGPYFDGAGMNPHYRGAFAVFGQNPDQVVAAGGAAKPTSAAATAAVKGKTVTRL